MFSRLACLSVTAFGLLREREPCRRSFRHSHRISGDSQRKLAFALSTQRYQLRIHRMPLIYFNTDVCCCGALVSDFNPVEFACASGYTIPDGGSCWSAASCCPLGRSSGNVVGVLSGPGTLGTRCPWCWAKCHCPEPDSARLASVFNRNSF